MFGSADWKNSSRKDWMIGSRAFDPHHILGSLIVRVEDPVQTGPSRLQSNFFDLERLGQADPIST
jgi:hypothetical protein